MNSLFTFEIQFQTSYPAISCRERERNEVEGKESDDNLSPQLTHIFHETFKRKLRPCNATLVSSDATKSEVFGSKPLIGISFYYSMKENQGKKYQKTANNKIIINKYLIMAKESFLIRKFW